MSVGWIHYKDVRPRKDQPVIYFEEHIGVWRGFYRGHDEYGGVFVPACHGGFIDATHWMPDDGRPLPDRPNGTRSSEECWK